MKYQGVDVGGITLVREALPFEYANLLENNPLLAKVQGDLRTGGQWSDLEIRTAQLLLAVKVIAELQGQIQAIGRNFLEINK